MHRALAFHSLLFLTIALCDARPALSPRQLLPVSPTGQPPDLPSSNTTSNDPTLSFTDGGGTGFNPPAILWIVFASLLGLPLAFAGVRGWRLTSGIGLGLTLSFFIWSAFVNTTTGTSLAANPVTSDLLLSLFVCGIFLLGVAFGALRIGILAGVSSLGASGGAALGILIALLRPGLLIPIYALNIVPIGLFGVAGAAWPIWHQRLAVIVSSSACGSFLIGLAVDLILNKQSGMSRGIRFLLDRNSVHLAATLEAGYKPSLSTWIIVGVSIGLIPVFSYLQHRIFREPFDRSPESLEAYKRLVNGAPILGPGDEGYVPHPSKEDDKFTVAPQHIRMRFPSIIPSLPGRVDPRYTAQQQAMRREQEAMEAASGRPVPAPGIGRMNFVPGWNVAVTAVKRMSTSFANGASGAARRMSTSFANGATGAARRLSTNFASGAARRMSTTFGFGNGGLRAPVAEERRVSTLSVPSIYSVASRQNGYAAAGTSAGANAASGPGPTSRLQYENTRAYTGTQLVPIRPLQLPNRQYTTPTPTRNPDPPQSSYAPSSYTPSTRSGPAAPRTPAPAPAPVASLRSNKGGWGGANGLPSTPTAYRSVPNTPSRSTPSTPNRSTPNTPNRSTPNTPNRSELAYYGTPPTPRSATSSSTPKETGRNRLKTATRYNLL